MSLVTRCPACATTFKVVKDQLRISDGWVRCGRCSQVFDATIDLQETPESDSRDSESGVPDAPNAPAVSDAPATEAPPETTGSLETSAALPPPSDAESSDLRDRPAPSSNESAPPAFAASGPDLSHLIAEESWAEWQQPLPEPVPHVIPSYRSIPPFPVIDLTLPSSRPVPIRDPGSAALNAAPPMPAAMATPIRSPTEPQAIAAAADDVSFQKALRRAHAKSTKIAKARSKARKKAQAGSPDKVQPAARESASWVPSVSDAGLWDDVPDLSAKRSSSAWMASGNFWRGAKSTRIWLPAGLVLICVLVLQIMHNERDSIVARQPGLRPALSALCRVTGCEISALRRIGDITIDGASFSREKSDDAYRLRFTLRSAAGVPLATPAVELSLLDTQERAVVRRVLMPSDFGAPDVLPARGQREASLQLTLVGPELARLPPVVGYRVEALYP
ncbi:MAG: DUF3426 domain-containing protein [Gammaproteobacteria bacterium]|nr:DUF3426 domain-containing protein [Gammaproteobacteria bacterium]